MLKGRSGLVIMLLFLASAPAAAQTPAMLEGKFTFNWHSDPAREKCRKVMGSLLASFKSAEYRCDLEAKNNSSSGATVRTCTEVKGDKEYLVFDTLRACERERKEQESNS